MKTIREFGQWALPRNTVFALILLSEENIVTYPFVTHILSAYRSLRLCLSFCVMYVSPKWLPNKAVLLTVC